MIIDKEKLISMLVEKTGLEPEEVEEQLSKLVNRIKKAADEGKTFKIEGFGTFKMEGDDLQFEPDSTLETEINNKYAGMKPIELIGAFKEPKEEEIPEIPNPEKEGEGIWTFDDESIEQTEAEESEPQQEEKPVAEAETEEKPKATTESEIEENIEEESAAAKAELPTEGKDVVASEEPQKESIIEEEQEVENSVEKEPKKVTTRTASEKDPIGRVLMVAVVIIVIGIAGWLIYDWGISSGQNTNVANQTFSSQRVQQQPSVHQTGKEKADSQKQADQAQNTSANKNSEPEQNSQVIKQGGTQSEPSPDSNTPYGLRGDVNQTISSAYTIVVHSLKDKTKAEANRQRLQKEGFRAVMHSANINGTMHYRVGIGQFKSIGAAQQAIEKLPEPYKSHNFIKRVTQQ